MSEQSDNDALPYIPETEQFDPETGEERRNVDLEEIAGATTAKLLRRRPMSADEIARATKDKEPIPCGVLGWFAKIGEQTGKGGKKIPGSRIKGQIVGAMSSIGRYGEQRSIVVFGRYVAPAHQKGTTKIPAIDKVGRWMVGVDATLVELPGHVGDILDLEMETRGGPGTPHPRHTYKVVNIWPIDSLAVTPEE